VKVDHQIAGLGMNGKVENYGPVSDSELAALYRKSLALVYASLYEGFGIPPLEAMQSGTLVIAADRSSIPEVVGNAGMLFDPDNRDALTDILVHVARNPEERQPFIERGYQRARQFTWDKTVRDTLEVYRNLVR
jgi:glycosyltransferase involved in cell wall biosynthesis